MSPAHPHTSPAHIHKAPPLQELLCAPLRGAKFFSNFSRFSFLFSLGIGVYVFIICVSVSVFLLSNPPLTSLSFLSFVCSSIYSFINDGSFILEMILRGFSGTFQTRTDKCFPRFSPSCLSIIRSVHPPLPGGSAHFLLLELISVYIIVF